MQRLGASYSGVPGTVARGSQSEDVKLFMLQYAAWNVLQLGVSDIVKKRLRSQRSLVFRVAP